MTATEYLVGVLWLLFVGAGFGALAVVLRSWLLPGVGGARARLAEAVLGIAGLTVTMQILGLVGLLGPISLLTVALGTAAALLASRGAWRSPKERAVATPTGPAEPAWALQLALAVAVLTVVHWSTGIATSAEVGIYRQDSTWYHLPQAATFFQTGDTWSLHFTDPMALAAWFYPMGAELPHTVGMLAFGNDFLSPFVNLIWVLLAMLAAWCAGRPLGLAAPSVVAVAIVLDSGMLEAQAGNAPGDAAAVALLLAMAAFLLDGSRLLAALAGGLAIGVKVTLLVPVAAAAVGDVLLSGRVRRVAAACVWGAALPITGGYWYVRNLVHAGNPLPWVSPGPLVGPDQVDLYPRPPHALAEYATELGFWAEELAPRLAGALGPLGPAILAAALAGLALAVLRGTPAARVLGIAGVAAAVAYVFIPVSASGSPGNPSGFDSNLRYLAPALALGLQLLVLDLGRRLPQGLLSGGLVGALAVGVAAAGEWDWDLLRWGAPLALCLVVAPAALVLGRRWGASGRGAAESGQGGAESGRGAAEPGRAIRRRRAVIALGAAVVACLTIAAGYPAQRDYFAARYLPELAPPPDNPGFRATPEWRRLQAWALRQRERRIGVVGPAAAFGQYVFYGPNLSNRVGYVGEPGPRGAYRPIGDCASWRRAIAAGGYEFVVVTPASAIGPGTLPQETLWLNGAVGAEAVLRAGAGSVFRIDPRLSPEGCDDPRLPRVVRVPGGGYALPSTGPQGLPTPLPLRGPRG